MDQTLAFLVADDPRISAGRLLDHIAARYKAKGAAAVTVDSGELASFAGEVPLSRLAALQLLWQADAKDLRSGRSVIRDGCSVLPLMDGHELTGLLLVESHAAVETRSPAVIERNRLRLRGASLTASSSASSASRSWRSRSISSSASASFRGWVSLPFAPCGSPPPEL